MTRARDVANLIGSGNYSSTTFTATAGQTAFTISHTQGFVQVFMNGLLLDETVDYTSNGSAVTLTSGAAAGDEIEVVAYNTFSVGDALNQAAADTRYVNTAGDTMTGNLGVKATLKTTHADADVVQFGGTGYLANWEDAETYLAENLYVNSSGGYKYLTTSHASLYSQTTGKHQFKVAPSGSADGTPTLTTGLEIDNSGRVTTPNQPSFHAYMSQSNPTITSNPTKIPYSSVRWDIGNNFDETNHRYVAPVAGVYNFQVNHNVYDLSDDQYFRTRVYVNGSSYQILGYMRARGGGDHTTNDSFLLNLSVNDYVEIYTSSSDGSYKLSASAGWNSFSGFLVG